MPRISIKTKPNGKPVTGKYFYSSGKYIKPGEFADVPHGTQINLDVVTVHDRLGNEPVRHSTDDACNGFGDSGSVEGTGIPASGAEQNAPKRRGRPPKGAAPRRERPDDAVQPVEKRLEG